MKYVSIIIIINLMTIVAYAQGPPNGLDTLGWLPGGSASYGSGLSPEGNVVSGAAIIVDSTGQYQVPTRWTPAAGLQQFTGLPGGRGGHMNDAASNGNFFCGIAFDAQGRSVACRWSGQNSITSLGFLPNGSSSSAKAISDDGQAIAGSANSDSGSTGIYWTQAGGLVDIGDLPGGTYYSTVEGMSGDGQVVVGWSRGADEFPRAFKWTPGGGMTNLGVLPTYIASHARGASLDGSVIVGSCTRNDSVGQTIQAFRWTAAGGMQGLGWLPGGQASRAYRVSNDGKVIVGTASSATIPSDLFIWRENIGMMRFAYFLQSEYGIDISDWNYFFISDISADGKAFSGYGRDANNRFMGWRIKLPPVAILAPTGGERLQVGQSDTIRWEAHQGNLFLLDYSPDDGANYFNIGTTTSPGDSQYVWKISDSLVTSSHYRIRITDSVDPTITAESSPFTIKGYDLTRTLPGGSLQVFDPSRHGWQFPNNSNPMWPNTWWQQFNYITGTDPHTGDTYPEEFTEPPVNALPWHFPDWPLFVDVFTTDQAYWSTFAPIYKDAAIEKWRTSKRNWGGSCYGFAISSLLAFDYKTEFLQRYPTITQADSIFFLAMTDDIRKAINGNYVTQYGQAVLDNDVIGKPKSPRALLQEAKTLFLDESQDGRAVTMFNVGGSGAHTMLPYRLKRDRTQANLWRLFVYDSNNPNNGNVFILIDSTANTWADGTGLGWGPASNRCYLEPSSGLFLSPPDLELPNTMMENAFLQAYTGSDMEVAIYSGAGGEIGYQDSVAFNTLSDGIAIIPKTGGFHPPIGYYLPAGSYRAELSEFSDSLASFSMLTDSLIYRYSRSDADFSQQDFLSLDGGLGIGNPDATVKTIELAAIARFDSSERMMTVSGLETAGQDSLHFSVVAGSEVKLANAGIAKQYGLRLSQSDAAGEMVFNHQNIDLPADAAHQVVPVWDDLSQPATIYIDFGNDGTIDDSVTVQNQVTSIDDGATGQADEVGIPERFILAQNYPNPFNPQTTIRFAIPAGYDGAVELAIFDVMGKRIRNLVIASGESHLPAGWQEFVWDGRDDAGNLLASGVYFYRLAAGKRFVQTRKMLLVR